MLPIIFKVHKDFVQTMSHEVIRAALIDSIDSTSGNYLKGLKDGF
jgi:hypothetical protein